ncbi:glycoside hydrolase family 3 protein [Schizophyllum commune]
MLARLLAACIFVRASVSALQYSYTSNALDLSACATPDNVLECGDSEILQRRADRDAFLDALVADMSVEELSHQLHLMFSDNVIGPKSELELYDSALAPYPNYTFGSIHDFYPTDKAQYNDLQALNLNRSAKSIPFMQLAECLHGVGSFKQSMFPVPLAMAASWDPEVVYSVGRAIGKEARSVGIHACLAPVLDLGKEPRWGRTQEAWGEDHVLTSHMGVAFAGGLSKNGSWSDPDAVVPVVKHFAAHGSPRGGINAAPFMGRGLRQVMQEMFVPFKAAFDLGGAHGVMMAYHELDEIPAHVHPMLYAALEEWGFNGMAMLYKRHTVTTSDADTMQQYLNAGGMIQYYDFSLATWRNTLVDLVANSTLPLPVLQERVKRVLGVKYDLGLFDNPYVPDDINAAALLEEHVSLTLEMAQKSLVLLENRNKTLPLDINGLGIEKIALVGPFADTLNYGGYSGPWGMNPNDRGITLREGILSYLDDSVDLVTTWGAESWLYHAQYSIPAYAYTDLNGTSGGLTASYFADPDANFSDATPAFTHSPQTPNRDWGLYPPLGLSSNNFSVVWEGSLTVPTLGVPSVSGWLGAAVSPNISAEVFIDGAPIASSAATPSGNTLSNIESYVWVQQNATLPPAGGAEFTFESGKTYAVRVELRVWNLAQKIENVNSVNAHIELWWNLAGREGDGVQQAVQAAEGADLIVLAVGANWNSDGESGDRATLSLSPNQTALADAMFDLDIPVVMILQGGRPFAIPDYYDKSAAVINAFFPGQSGGQAIADALFGTVTPGGRVPISVPYNDQQLPVYYNDKYTARAKNYTDVYSYAKYPFGYGLSYSTFTRSNFNATPTTFSSGDNITFHVDVTNTGKYDGSDVVQVYLLVRRSTIVRPQKQLVAFARVYLEPGETQAVEIQLEVDRYLPIVDRTWKWVLEEGDYTFALLDHGGYDADTSTNVTITCV